jgi:PPP family 3-phenylpropionic acid transporter
LPSALLTRPALATGAVYVVLFMATGVQMPFWPLWLADWGLRPEEVGLYTALGVAVRVVAGMAVPALADRLDRRRQTLAACAALTLLLTLAHLGIATRPALLAATVAVGAAMAGTGPLAEALGVAAARAARFPYAPVRGVGSAGFLAANLVVGALIARTGSGVALWWIAGCMALLVPLALAHPGGRRVERQPPRMGEIGRLVLNPTFAIFMGLFAFSQGSHAMLYALGSVHWRDLGIGGTEIGALWALSVAAEIVFLMLFGTWTIERLGPVRAMGLAAAAGVLRWSLMTADPTGLWLWPLQCLHAFTFGASHLGAIAFITRAVPDRYAAAAQGAGGAMAAGAVMAGQMALAAWLYPSLGGATYALGAASSALGLLFCLWLARRWRGEELAV